MPRTLPISRTGASIATHVGERERHLRGTSQGQLGELHENAPDLAPKDADLPARRTVVKVDRGPSKPLAAARAALEVAPDPGGRPVDLARVFHPETVVLSARKATMTQVSHQKVPPPSRGS
jgi:hypothetical protein